MAAGFSSSNQIMGVRKTTDFLEKATWSLAGTIVVLSIVSAAFITRNAGNKSEIQDMIKKEIPAMPDMQQNQNVPVLPAATDEAN